MCGIAGILTLNTSNLSISKLKLMTDAIAHRGPDGDGQWINETAQIGLGHRRLSIIDLSVLANQPMHYLDRYTIVFNGEIYNYLELKQELMANDYVFTTQSDTEVLLALYDLKKDKCLQQLDGMFAFAIWDKQTEILFCARDRFGEKPFYYYHNEHSFYFASEMKALWAAGVPKLPNEQQVFLYLAYGAQNNENAPASTFYANIQQLEHSHCFSVHNNIIINHYKYWDIDVTKRNNNITLQEAKDTFTQLFTTSIQRRLRSDVPVGSSLSGGLDSSSIVSIVNKMKDNNQIQKTFSARFEGFIRDEGKYINTVVKANNVEAHQVFLTPDLLNKQLNEVITHQEEPFGSTSIIAQWEVMKLAKHNGIKVLLDGQGADEFLAGYPQYFYNYYSSLALHNLTQLKQQKKHYYNLNNCHYNYGNYLMLHAYFPNLRNTIRVFKNKTIKPHYFKQFAPRILHAQKNTTFNYSIKTDLNQALYVSMLGGGLQNLLRYADRNAMAHGVEVRLPFLNHELVAFVFSLPDEMKLHNGWTKFILRESMNELLPAEICWRKEKVGFEPPNYKHIPPNMAQEAKIKLTNAQILQSNVSTTNLNWEYYQVSKLY